LNTTADVSTIVLSAVVGYQCLLLAVGLWASRRTHSSSDFFLGGRKVGPWVTGISYSASASSAWALLGVSGAAFAIGPSVVWVALGSLSGMVFAWWWIAPRLLDASHQQQLTTFIDFLRDPNDNQRSESLVRSAAVIVLVAFVFYVAAQFQGAGLAVTEVFAVSDTLAIVCGALVILVYTWLGGYWAVSLTDAIQGVVMCLAAIALPLGTVISLGGLGPVVELIDLGSQRGGDTDAATLSAIGFVIGSLAISLGTFGQPHLMVRFMALKDHRARHTAARITLIWYLVVFSGMVLTGLVGRGIFDSLDNNEQVFFALSEQVLPPVLAGLLLAAVLSAIMSTADSQLLVCASTLSHDLTNEALKGSPRVLRRGRWAVVIVVVLAVLVALFLPAPIFSRVLFAWSALGAALGPTLFARLLGWQIPRGYRVTGIWSGFGLTVVLSLLPNAPGDILERLLPFVVHSLLLIWVRRR
jgi:sodium/proline symporter